MCGRSLHGNRDRLEAVGVLTRVSRRMRNAKKVVQGASLYVFGRITEAEQKMVQKAKALAKATARAASTVLRPRPASESQRETVPAENLILLSGKRGKPSVEPSTQERAGVGLQMKALLASLRGQAAV